MQEMANAPFFPNTNMTKEEYAKQEEEIELAEAKAFNEEKPGKMTRDDADGNVQQQESPQAMKNSRSYNGSPPMPTKMVFIDFDYQFNSGGQ